MYDDPHDENDQNDRQMMVYSAAQKERSQRELAKIDEMEQRFREAEEMF